MPRQDRLFKRPSEEADRAAVQKRGVSGNFGTTVSADPIAGAVRARIALAADADGFENRRRGPKQKRELLLRLVEFIETQGHTVGEVVDSEGNATRIGTAEKGALVQAAAKHLNLSPARVRDLVRQIAELAGEWPERLIGGRGNVEPGN